jgi:hypothetical protein
VNLEQLTKETNTPQPEKYDLVGCDTVEFGDSPTVRNKLSPQYSVWVSKPSKKPIGTGEKLNSACRLLLLVAQLALSEIHGVTSQNTADFMPSSDRTPNSIVKG